MSDNTQKKGFRGAKQRYVCMKCNQNWTDGAKPREKMALEEKIDMVKKAKDKYLSINITYKGVNRTVDPYAANQTYCTGYCNYRKALRTFKIDRMTNISLGNEFAFDGSMSALAEGQINNIKTYRNYY